MTSTHTHLFENNCHNLSLPCSFEGHLGCFYSLIIKNSAKINILTNASVMENLSSLYLLCGKTQFFPILFFSCVFPLLFTQNASLLTLLVTKCVEVSPHNKQWILCDTSSVLENLTEFWYYLRGGSIPSHRLRDLSHGLPSPHASTSVASHKSRLSPVLLINEL